MRVCFCSFISYGIFPQCFHKFSWISPTWSGTSKTISSRIHVSQTKQLLYVFRFVVVVCFFGKLCLKNCCVVSKKEINRNNGHFQSVNNYDNCVLWQRHFFLCKICFGVEKSDDHYNIQWKMLKEMRYSSILYPISLLVLCSHLLYNGFTICLFFCCSFNFDRNPRFIRANVEH